LIQIKNSEENLDLYFKQTKRIKAPVKNVFDTIYQPKELKKILTPDASGPLAEGSVVTWKFKGHKPFALHVHQVIENELIKFRWDDTSVCMTFRSIKGGTEFCLEATGWPMNRKGLGSSYDECEGWRDMLVMMKIYLEKGITYQDLSAL
jgi:uncharacterized protein YndB with AHSA1/START domain